MRCDVSSPRARETHARYVRFVEGYRARSAPARRDRPRVLWTGFGRFGEHTENASGLIARSWVTDEPPPVAAAGDPLAEAWSADAVVELSRAGGVDLRAAVLPVAWDVAAAMALAEVEAFLPDLVVMTGIGRPVQPVVLELGAQNAAARKLDASGEVQPAIDGAAILSAAGDGPVLSSLHWADARRAASEVWKKRCAERAALAAVVPGVELGAPRASNRYLCNATALGVSFGMSASPTRLQLLEGDAGALGVTLPLAADLRATPRVFIHVPSRLEAADRWDVRAIVAAVVDAQLARGTDTSPGDPADATYHADP